MNEFSKILDNKDYREQRQLILRATICLGISTENFKSTGLLFSYDWIFSNIKFSKSKVTMIVSVKT